MSDSAAAAPPAVPPSGPIPVPPNIGDLAASQLIGSLLNWWLYGVLLVQVYVYRLSFPNDKGAIKALVYSIFVTETVMTALNGYDVYTWFAAGFGDMIKFMNPLVSPVYTPIFGGFIALIVQSFFCYRIYIIKRAAWPISVFIFLVSIIQAIGGMGSGSVALMTANENHDGIRNTLVYMWLIGDAIADVFIAVTMSYLLLSASRQQHKQTNDIVRRIVRLTVETNTLSTVTAIVSLILFYGVPNTTYFIGPTMVLAKLYANTLLVTFNNRAFIHGTGNSSTANDSYAPRTSGRTRSMPFSAGLGLSTDDTETFQGSYSTGKVTVTTHSVVDNTYGNTYSPHAYDMNRLEEGKTVPL
ncbi:hypothetical protein MKEN_00607900 [Mycena kentingensis (nom. inval.)]|nr:hypothetical protein MKEN_00607900 [Mycena kentingensis (nom. inval.)]